MASQHIKIAKTTKRTTKTKYRKSKTSKKGNQRRCNGCGRFL